MKLMLRYHIEPLDYKQRFSPSVIETAKEKTKRRFLRYLKEGQITHRVSYKDKDTLELQFYRRTSNKLTVRYRRVTNRNKNKPFVKK